MTRTVAFKIQRIAQLEYSIKAKKLGFTIDADNCETLLEMRVGFLSEVELVHIIPSIKYIDKRDNEELMSFQAGIEFSIQDFKNAFLLQDDGRVNVPDHFMLEAISLSIGAVRGMLVIKNSGTYLADVVLPIFDSADILNHLKESMKADITQPQE